MQVALVVVAVVDLIAIGSGYAEFQLLGTEYTVAEANANDLRQGAIGVFQFLLLILTAVFFIRWFKRAYENTDHLSRRYGTGWAIGGWFVPILNLWRPKEIANDIWRASNETRQSGVSPVLTLWWLAWVAANVLSSAALRVSFAAESSEELQSAAAVYAVSDSVDVVAALLALWVVRMVTRRQLAAEQVHPDVSGPRVVAAE